MTTTERVTHLSERATYRAGDPPPPQWDYLGWHEWAETQHRAGLRQVRCARCCLWRYPQELSGRESVSYPTRRDGTPVEMRTPLCRECAAIRAAREAGADALSAPQRDGKAERA